MIKKKIKASGIKIKNKKAFHDYLVIDKYVAGIVLTGTEIKSIREAKAGLTDSFCYIQDGEIWIKNMYISEYTYASYNKHDVRRDRKLLLNKKEIKRLYDETRSPGFTIIPLEVFINEKKIAKVEIGLCRGKKEYDKRAAIKEQETKRDINRTLKNYKYGL